MIQSMTGFGRGEAETEQYAATVELRSVNNRFCDVRARLPHVLAPFETAFQNRIQAVLARGKIDAGVQLTPRGENALGKRVDVAAVAGYARLLQDVRDAAGLDEPVRLEHLLQYPDIFASAEDDDAAQHAWAAVEPALEHALEAMLAMRRLEGRAMQADLEQRLDAIAHALDDVEARAPERVVEARTRLFERIEELLGPERYDPDRLEQEIALLADRLDVTEECVRLRSHLDQFRAALAQAEAVGRRLNFLVQEMNREINTIGSKANDAATAHLAVGMKEELERIREQVQNVQ